MNFEDLWNLWECEISNFPNENQGVILASSGHLDSIALFSLFCLFSKSKKKFLKGVIHVNYNLRGQDSQNDQKTICELANQHNIPVHVFQASHNDKNLAGKSFQEWAREVRYEHFQSFIDQGYVVALAHHQDDQIENILMRVLRGAEVSHLKMPRYRQGIWRPLLHIPKSQLKEYADNAGLPYGYDFSNEDTKYVRNHMRQTILPLLYEQQPKAGERLKRLADDAQSLHEYVALKLSQDFADLNALSIEETVKLDFPVFKTLLGLVIKRTTDAHLQWHEDHLRKIWQKMATSQNFRFDLGHDVIFIAEGTTWRLEMSQEHLRQDANDPLSRARMAVDEKLQIPPGGTITFSVSHNKDWQITNLSSSKRLDIDIKTAKLKEKVLSVNGLKKWQIKELYQRNRKKLCNGAILYMVGPKENAASHLFDGASFLKPDASGNLIKVNVDELSINVVTNAKPS